MDKSYKSYKEYREPEEEKENQMLGIWEKYKDPLTGKDSIENHTLKTLNVWCAPKDHVFEYVEGGAREIKCTICDYESTFILGRHKLSKGKLCKLDCK